MIHSRRGRGLALGAGVLAAGAVALAAAPAATAAESSNAGASNATTRATTTVAEQGARPGPTSDQPYVGARLVPTKDGATVSHVVDGGPADTAGVTEGDIVLSIDGVSLDHKGSLREAMKGVAPGDELKVVLTHDGSQESVVITVGDPADRPAPPAAADIPWVGARLVHFEGKDGVVVRSVVSGGPADTAGLVVGDVVTAIDGTAVTDWWQAREILRNDAPGDTVKLAVDRDGKAVTLTMTLGSLDEAPKPSRADGSKIPAVGA